MADPGGTPQGRAHGPIAVYIDPVLERPFTSAFRERRYTSPTTPDAKPLEELTGTIRRDRFGRKRIDINVSDPDGRIIAITSIWDVVAGFSYVFSDMSPVVQAIAFPKPNEGDGILPAAQEEEMVNDVRCRVIRIKTTVGSPSAEITVWASDDLRHPIKQHTKSSEHLTVWELIHPVTGDPDPAGLVLDERKFQILHTPQQNLVVPK